MKKNTITEQRSKRMDNIARKTEWAVVAGIMVLAIILAISSGDWIIVPAAGVYAFLMRALLHVAFGFVSGIVFGRSASPEPKVTQAKNDADDSGYRENRASSFLKQMEKDSSDYATHPTYSSLSCNIFHRNDNS